MKIDANLFGSFTNCDHFALRGAYVRTFACPEFTRVAFNVRQIAISFLSRRIGNISFFASSTYRFSSERQGTIDLVRSAFTAIVHLFGEPRMLEGNGLRAPVAVVLSSVQCSFAWAV